MYVKISVVVNIALSLFICIESEAIIASIAFIRMAILKGEPV